MEQNNGLTSKGLSQGSPPTETGQYFLPEWITGVFYGGCWHEVREGTFREGIGTDQGDMAVYEDPFDGQILFITEPITGFRVKKPTPPEPKASVTELHPKK